MMEIDLSPEIEKRFAEVVRNNYDGNSQAAIVTLLELHRKYGWKEQLRQNVQSVRAEVGRRGGINSEAIDKAVKRYRNSSSCSDA